MLTCTCTPRSASLSAAALQQYSLPPQRCVSLVAINTIRCRFFKGTSQARSCYFQTLCRAQERWLSAVINLAARRSQVFHLFDWFVPGLCAHAYLHTAAGQLFRGQTPAQLAAAP